MRRNIWRTITLSIAIAMAPLIFFASSFAQDAAVLPSPDRSAFQGQSRADLQGFDAELSGDQAAAQGRAKRPLDTSR